MPNSYTVTNTDPYTGEKSTQQIDKSTIEISITNQQYTYSNGSSFYIYYSIRTKGHFAQNWTEIYSTYPMWANAQAYESPNYKNDMVPYIAYTAEDPENSFAGLPQSQSAYTTITIPVPAQSGQVDFQVKAMIGKKATFYDPTNNIFYDPLGGGVDRPGVAYVTSSDWSNTQTIDLANGLLFWPIIVSLLLFAFAVAVVLVIRHRRTRTQAS